MDRRSIIQKTLSEAKKVKISDKTTDQTNNPVPNNTKNYFKSPEESNKFVNAFLRFINAQSKKIFNKHPNKFDFLRSAISNLVNHFDTGENINTSATQFLSVTLKSMEGVAPRIITNRIDSILDPLRSISKSDPTQYNQFLEKLRLTYQIINDMGKPQTEISEHIPQMELGHQAEDGTDIAELHEGLNLPKKIKPTFNYASLLYRDGANFKTFFLVKIPDELKDTIQINEERPIEDFGISQEEMYDDLGINYDENYDHNLVDVLDLHVVIPDDATPLINEGIKLQKKKLTNILEFVLLLKRELESDGTVNELSYTEYDDQYHEYRVYPKGMGVENEISAIDIEYFGYLGTDKDEIQIWIFHKGDDKIISHNTNYFLNEYGTLINAINDIRKTIIAFRPNNL